MKANSMNGKKYAAAAILLSTVLLALSATFHTHLTAQAQPGGPRTSVLTGASGKFAPVIERVLSPAETQRVDILDLETGRAVAEPPFEKDFNARADAITIWIRSQGLDVSCFRWSRGAACITYDMIIVPVAEKCWRETTEQELIRDPDLSPGQHSPRRLLLLGDNRPDTFIFRTGEGTLGVLRFVDLGSAGKGVKIRYKLINPEKSVVARKRADQKTI